MKVNWIPTNNVAKIPGTEYRVRIYRMFNSSVWSWTVLTDPPSATSTKAHRGGITVDVHCGPGVGTLDEVKRYFLLSKQEVMIARGPSREWPSWAVGDRGSPLIYSPEELASVDPGSLDLTPTEWIGEFSDPHIPCYLFLLADADLKWRWHIWEKGLDPPWYDGRILDQGDDLFPYLGGAQSAALREFQAGFWRGDRACQNWSYTRREVRRQRCLQ